MNYRYREGELIAEFRKYIDSTYQQHYVTDGKQTMDSIIANGHGTGFCLGNVDKYKDRYGKKGETPDEWRKDLIKVMHYTLFQLFIHDKEHGNENLLPSSEVRVVPPKVCLNIDLDHELPSYENMVETDDKIRHNRNSIDDATPEEWDAVRDKIWSGEPKFPSNI